MSDLRDILSARQLIKHHDLIQFLTRNPNTRYTLAQLDYVLPSGASVQRFPDEWLQLMRGGHCGSRNIEVLMPGDDDEGENDDEERAGTASLASLVDTPGSVQTALDPHVVLLCRRPVIHTLGELATLLETPRSVPDPEGCAALQMSQVELPSTLLLEAQRRGLAYHFASSAQASHAPLSLAAPSSLMPASPSASFGALGATAMASADTAASLLSAASAAGGGVPTTVLPLPPGVRVRYRLLTHRGLTVGDEHCVPVQLHVGEVMQITLDNQNVARRAGIPNDGPWPPAGRHPRQPLRTPPSLHVEYGFVASKVKEQEAMRENPPLRIRMRSGPAHATAGSKPTHAAAAAAVDGGDSVNKGNDNVKGTNAWPVSTFTKVQLAVEAVRAERFRLRLRVRSILPPPQLPQQQSPQHSSSTTTDGTAMGDPSTESVMPIVEMTDIALDFDVVDADASPDGVLIGRERQPGGFTLPAAYTLADPAVAHGGAAGRKNTTGTSATAAETGDVICARAARVLPWWQSSSPCASLVRDATFPLEETVRAAANVVYTQRGLYHERRLRAARRRVREQQQGLKAYGSGVRARRRRQRARPEDRLRNCHLLHFGLDASVPFAMTRR